MSEQPAPPHPRPGDRDPEPPDPELSEPELSEPELPEPEPPEPEPPEPRRPDPMFQSYDLPDETEQERQLDESHPASLAAATYYVLDERTDPNHDEPPWDPS